MRAAPAGSDEEAAQYDDVLTSSRSEQPLPEGVPLTRTESDRMARAAEHVAWCQRLGIEPDPTLTLPTTEVNPQAHGPWSADRFLKGTTPSDVELAARLQETAETIVQRALAGDREAQEFVRESQQRTAQPDRPDPVGRFLQRMADNADEFCEDADLARFVKALAANNQLGMRQAARAIAQDCL